VSGHLALGDGHVDVARPTDDVDRSDRRRPVGHRRHRLGAAHGVELVDAGDVGRREHGIGDASGVAVRWHAHHDLGHPGDPSRHRGHQDGGGVLGTTARDVEAGPIDRALVGADPNTWLLDDVRRTQLGPVEPVDGLGGGVERRPQHRVDALGGGGQLLGRHPELLEAHAVEAGRQLDQGIVALAPHALDDLAGRPPRLVTGEVGSG
jgi:hypothetical protein